MGFNDILIIPDAKPGDTCPQFEHEVTFMDGDGTIGKRNETIEWTPLFD